ncbi:MAG: metal-dependent phosphohydrolase [Desulfobulbaceae bacterium A2]|nr:MAG: metal-dependent phosphohydrolase [Desulfobulbaceae bacterium A2]
MVDQEAQRRFIQDYIDTMPSLSTSVAKVMELCSRSDTSPNDLNRVISLDPVLAGRVLKLINSAYYSLFNRVTSLTRAVIMLGLNTVKNLALSTAIIRCVNQAKKSKALPIHQFWAHSIGVGVASKLLAVYQGVSPGAREEYFVAGLLHDLGKIPFGDTYGEIITQSLAEGRDLLSMEQAQLGISHLDAGGMIAAKWVLNTSFTEAMALHHHPAQASEEHRRLVALVAIADAFCNTFEIGSAGNHHPDEAGLAEALQVAGLSWPEVVELLRMVDEEISKAEIFLQT